MSTTATTPTAEQKVAQGYVNPGWTPAAWAANLRRLAGHCETDHPDRARGLRTWADNVLLLATGRGGTPPACEGFPPPFTPQDSTARPPRPPSSVPVKRY